MALRTIRTEGDSVLEKVCRPVEKIDTSVPRIWSGDMLETMYDACGVGLAAPQVGVSKKNRSDRYRRRPAGSGKSGDSG